MLLAYRDILLDRLHVNEGMLMENMSGGGKVRRVQKTFFNGQIQK